MLYQRTSGLNNTVARLPYSHDFISKITFEIFTLFLFLKETDFSGNGDGEGEHV